MTTYRVVMSEARWERTAHHVAAESPEEARRVVEAGGGEEISRTSRNLMGWDGTRVRQFDSAEVLE